MLTWFMTVPGSSTWRTWASTIRSSPACAGVWTQWPSCSSLTSTSGNMTRHHDMSRAWLHDSMTTWQVYSLPSRSQLGALAKRLGGEARTERLVLDNQDKDSIIGLNSLDGFKLIEKGKVTIFERQWNCLNTLYFCCEEKDHEITSWCIRNCMKSVCLYVGKYVCQFSIQYIYGRCKL